MSNTRDLRVIEGQTGEIIDPDKPAFPGWGWAKRKLVTAGDAKTEIARVYRAAASGKISPDDLGRAVWALEKFARVSEIAEQEERIAALERRLEDLTRGRP